MPQQILRNSERVATGFAIGVMKKHHNDGVIDVAKNKAHTPKVWIFVADSRSNNDLSDLDHLDEILWGSNPNARKGDIVLMYRTAPYSDIAYIFSAISNPRATKPFDHADMKHVIELGEKIRLGNPITLKEIRNNARLSNWSFARHQHGVMRRVKDIKEEGFWQKLRALIIKRKLVCQHYRAGLTVVALQCQKCGDGG